MINSESSTEDSSTAENKITAKMISSGVLCPIFGASFVIDRDIFYTPSTDERKILGKILHSPYEASVSRQQFSDLSDLTGGDLKTAARRIIRNARSCNEYFLNLLDNFECYEKDLIYSDGEFNIRVKPDRIFIINNELLPIEIKTAKSKYAPGIVKAEYQTKAYLYVMELNNIPSTKGINLYLKNDSKTEIFLDSEDKQIIKTVIEDLKTIINDPSLFMQYKKDVDECDNLHCPLKRKCYGSIGHYF